MRCSIDRALCDGSHRLNMNVVDFPFDSKNANLAKITLDARYPEQGFAMNTVSEMTVYVLEGSVVLHTEDGEQVYNAGTAVCIPKGQKYFWNPDGQVTLLVFSTPPWTKEQQELFP